MSEIRVPTKDEFSEMLMTGTWGSPYDYYASGYRAALRDVLARTKEGIVDDVVTLRDEIRKALEE